MGHLNGRFGIFGKWIFWMTLLYLVCELAFSASLLDLCSRDASMSDINALERLGRTLTGVAISLFFIGVFIDKDEDITILKWRVTMSPATKIFLAVVYVAVCSFINNKIQDWVVDSKISTTYVTPTERKNAFLLTLAGRSLANGTLHITSIHQPEVLSHTPSMKAFVAIFPALAFNYPDVQREINLLLRDAIELNVKKPCEGGYDVRKCLGSAEQFNNNTWPQVVHTMESEYSKYVNAYNTAVRKTSRDNLAFAAADAWDEYERILKSNYHISSPRWISRKSYEAARSLVRKKGIPVPDNWKPSDEATFRTAAKKGIYKKVWADFGKQVGVSNPTKLLSLEQFVLLDNVQEQLRERIGFEDPTLIIPLVTKFDDVRRKVYEPIAQRIITRKKREADANPDSFMGMTNLSQRADTAVKTLVVVPLALLMSLLGGFGHAVKLLTITGKHFIPGTGHKPMVIALGLASLIVVSAVCVMYFLPNPLIDTNAYQQLATHTSGRGGAWYEVGLEFIVRLQEFVYPVNAKLLEYRTVLVAAICLIGFPLVIAAKRQQPPQPPVI